MTSIKSQRRRASIVSRRTHAGTRGLTLACGTMAVCTLFNGWVCHRKRNERYESSADGHSRARTDFCFKTFVRPRRGRQGCPVDELLDLWYYIRFQTLLSLCRRVWRACMAHFHRPSKFACTSTCAFLYVNLFATPVRKLPRRASTFTLEATILKGKREEEDGNSGKDWFWFLFILSRKKI